MKRADDALRELHDARTALLHEIADLRRREAEAEERRLDAVRRRMLREGASGDATEAHLEGFVRDLARTLQDAQRDRARARRDAEDLALRAARTGARREALEAVLVRVAAAAAGRQGS